MWDMVLAAFELRMPVPLDKVVDATSSATFRLLLKLGALLLFVHFAERLPKWLNGFREWRLDVKNARWDREEIEEMDRRSEIAWMEKQVAEANRHLR